jgi:chitodextrinase
MVTSNPGGKTATGSASPIVVSGLTNGTAYTFVVTATNAAGTSPPSASSNSVTPCTIPDAPTIGAATAGNALATVNFTPPTSNGGSSITGYMVTSSPGAKTATGSASPITITGLTNGTAYTFTVTATNAAGNSSPSSASNSVTPFTVPGAPTIGTATAGNALATVNFTPPVFNGGSPITGYKVISNPGAKTATGSGNPVVVSGLTNGTAYTFVVIATNAAGNSSPSASSNSVTPCTIPDAPTIGTATAGNALATVNFTPPTSNGGSSITVYTVTSNPGAKTATGSINPIVISGLTNGTAYTFVVTATNAAGTSPPSSASNSVTPFTVPDAPIIGTATAGNALATVNFTPPIFNGGSLITIYTVTSNPGAKTATGSASPIVVSGLTNGTAYTFVVIATNAAGNSPPSSLSNSVTPFTVPGAPIIGTATAGNALATVNFTPPPSNGGSPITIYTVTSNPGAKTATGSISPIVVSGLTNGTAYTFTVTATNAAGNSSPSSSSNSVTPCTVPGAPTIGTATAGNALATVNFTPPASDGGSLITIYTVTSNPGAKVVTGSASPITISGLTNDTPYTFTVTATNAAGTSLPSTASNSVTPSAKPPIIGSNSIDEMDVVKITDMSGLLPDGGMAVTVKAWDKDGKQLTEAGHAPPLSIINHGTSSILGRDLGDRFPDGAPAAYSFSVESSKMFITNVNNSIDGAVKVPIIYSNGLSNFVSNSIGTRNTLKLTDMSGTIDSSGIPITVTAWDASGKAIPESTSAAPLKLYSHGTTAIAGSSLPARFLPGVPMTYEFTVASPKLVISNVKNSSDGTLNIPTVYTVGVSSFVSNSIGSRNTIYISDFSGALDIGGAALSVRAWDVSGTEIPESVSVSSYKIFNYETVKITGAELGSRFSSGSPMTYEFTVDSSKVVITNVKSSSDGSINIPTVYTSGITNYTTNYVSDLNTIRITDMSGGIPAGGAITITARDGGGILIPESGSAVALKLNNHGTTTIEGNDLRNRFPGGTPVTYEFSIGSPIVVVTNLTESTDGTINIPAVFTIGPCGGI